MEKFWESLGVSKKILCLAALTPIAILLGLVSNYITNQSIKSGYISKELLQSIRTENISKMYNEAKYYVSVNEESLIAIEKSSKNVKENLAIIKELESSDSAQEILISYEQVDKEYSDLFKQVADKVLEAKKLENKISEEFVALENELRETTVKLDNEESMGLMLGKILSKEKANYRAELKTFAAYFSAGLLYIKELISTNNFTEFDKQISGLNNNVAVAVQNLNSMAVNLASEDGAGWKVMDGRWSNLQTLEARIYAVLKEKIPLTAKLDSLRETLNKKLIEFDNLASESIAGHERSAFIFSVLFVVVFFILSVVLSYVIIRSISGELTTISDQLSKTTELVVGSSKTLLEASEGINLATTSQASALEETSSSLTEISNTVQENVNHAETSRKIAREMRDFSDRGNHVVQDLIKSMNDIDQSNQDIQGLFDLIRQIGDKTAIIDEIVFQTKLLSFNASVEAERAGEHGRGFAVVAQEVGNLASMSGKAAEEISSLVRNSISDAKLITDNNKSKVSAGTKGVHEVAEVLGAISNYGEKVLVSAEQIASASKEQAGGINQITSAVTSLDEETQKNAQMANNASTTCTTLADEADKLRNMVDHLLAIIYGAK